MNLFGCISANDATIELFRSKDLALFALLGISRRDCASLMNMIEQVDINFQRTISIIPFAKRFCGEYNETFLYLFRLYFSLVVPKNVIIEAVDKPEVEDDDNATPQDEQSIQQGSVENSSVASKATPGVLLQASVTEDKLPYHYLLSFLLLFMSIRDGNISSWLFWLCFIASEQKPDHNNMEQLITFLWPKLEKHKIKIEHMKKKAQNMLIIVDPADIDPSKMRMFDANTGGAWSKPILMLRKRIRANSLGYFAWRRLSSHIANVACSIDEAYIRLKEPYKLSRWGKKNVALTGERKLARKEVRVVVRLHMSYIQMLSEFDGSEITGGSSSRRGSNRSIRTNSVNGDDMEGITTLQYLYLIIGGGLGKSYKMLRNLRKRLTSKSAQVYPTASGITLSGESGALSSTAAGNSSAKQQKLGDTRRFTTMDYILSSVMRMRQTASGPAPVIVDKEEFINLEEKYKDSLHMPIDIMYRRVEDAQSRAQRMMELCEDEIAHNTFDPVEWSKKGSSTAAAGAFRLSRQVVDVSDSEDGDNINDEGGVGEGSSFDGSSDAEHNVYEAGVGAGADGGYIEGDGVYEYSDSEDEDMNAKPEAPPMPKVLKSIMKKR